MYVLLVSLIFTTLSAMTQSQPPASLPQPLRLHVEMPQTNPTGRFVEVFGAVVVSIGGIWLTNWYNRRNAEDNRHHELVKLDRQRRDDSRKQALFQLVRSATDVGYLLTRHNDEMRIIHGYQFKADLKSAVLAFKKCRADVDLCTGNDFHSSIRTLSDTLLDSVDRAEKERYLNSDVANQANDAIQHFTTEARAYLGFTD